MSSRSPLLLLTLLLSYFTLLISAANKDEWRKRSIYQVMVDRFARTDGSTTAPCNVKNRDYCGGTWKGIQNNLDYIQGMGFDAIWISPMSKGIEGMTGDGSDYTGYWVTDMNTPNEHFGTADDLKALSAELHNRGMFLMLDIVVNNMAYSGNPNNVDYSTLHPLNDQSYFHPYCPINYSDRDSTLNCWMGSTVVPLPDINTESAEVQSIIKQWVTSTVQTYGIDGLRVDAAKSIPYAYAQMVNNATNSYAMGEVFDGDAGYACQYQANGLDGFLNFPVYFQLVSAFYSTGSTQMPAFPVAINNIRANCIDPTVLGTFTETHDVPRMAYYTQDDTLLKAVSTWNILYDGIPIVYQGQEQRYRGGDDPYNREAVWLSGFVTNTPLYQLFKYLNAFRKAVIAHTSDYVTTLSTILYSDFETIVFLKKEVMMVLSNGGSTGNTYSVTIPMGNTFQAGTEFTDIIGCGKVKVASTGDFIANIVNGMPQVWYPSTSLQAINITCGIPSGDDTATNTAANADSPSGVHDPYGGTTYTPDPSPASGGQGISGLNRLRNARRSSVTVQQSSWTTELWTLGWACLGGLLVWVL